MKAEKDFQVGDEGYYQEDGCKWRCTVISIESRPQDDDELLEVTLRMEEVIRPNPIVRDPEIGEEFTVNKLVQASQGCGILMWYLSEVA